MFTFIDSYFCIVFSVTLHIFLLHYIFFYVSKLYGWWKDLQYHIYLTDEDEEYVNDQYTLRGWPGKEECVCMQIRCFLILFLLECKFVSCIALGTMLITYCTRVDGLFNSYGSTWKATLFLLLKIQLWWFIQSFIYFIFLL